MADLSRAYLRNPVRVEVSPPGRAVEKVSQSVHFVAKDAKQALLIDLLDTHRDERSLVFARTKHGAERLMKQLDRVGFAAASIHGNKSQGQRDRALSAFRDGDIRVLVATDVAARGIDIPGVAYVYNYELPNVPENYVHRIGRTARAGAEGRAVAFCDDEEIAHLRSIEKILGETVHVAGGKAWQERGDLRASKPKPRGRHRSRRSSATRRAA
jgi:ATP-dependent RNA helicase RhlE